MIGFSQDLKEYKSRREDETPETKDLSKQKLYEMVDRDWMLPPASSKGITREYLLAVRNGDVFRVKHADYKTFDFNVSKAHLRKIGEVNNALLVRKLNRLLQAREQKELGYTEYNLPEQNWLYKVARYIDRTNLLEFFEAAPVEEPPLSDESTSIAQIYYGRKLASEYLFSKSVHKRNKKLWESFLTLSEKYRTVISMKCTIDVLQHELATTTAKCNELELEVRDLVGKVAFTYTALEDPSITPEEIIAGGTKLKKEQLEKLNKSTNL